MYIVPEEMRAVLRRPVGALMQFDDFVLKYGKRKIIAVGDIVTLSLLSSGIAPFIAVYDFRTLRSKLGDEEQGKIRAHYPKPETANNPPGTITEELENKAAEISRRGGALFVNGEEDLAALAFMLVSPPECVIIYGQPYEGVVAVECGEEAKKKARGFFKKMERK